MRRFRAHAERDLRAWGMLPEPSLSMMVEEVRAETGAGPGPVAIDDARLAAFLEAHPEHPDLLEMSIRRAIKSAGTPDAATLDRLRTYARVRPVDPWPHRELARAALAAGDGAAAIPHLEFIDAREGSDPSFALELARLERARGDRRKALGHATKAARIDAYTPATREFAAALAVEAGNLQAARLHVQALGFLEPDEPRHQARLARIDELIAGAR